MITKAELEKIVEDGAEYYATNEGATIEKREAFTVDKHLGNPQQYEYVNRYNNDSFCAFKSGCSFVTGILMPEIERVENNCDTLENKAIFWMETNDRAIEHTESLQLTITTLKTEIQSLKDERDSAIKAMDYHINSDMRTQEKIQSLKDEIEVLRRYGNKDCTAMADEALAQKAEVVDKCPPHSWDASGERCTKCGDKDWMT